MNVSSLYISKNHCQAETSENRKINERVGIYLCFLQKKGLCAIMEKRIFGLN
ncbi:hypothetical protein HMPREF7545_0163 [Selenomonas noxia ATCC 43541]|nr:hypothetical protein HMPREF7545_0163 [Selenomonas noxia ATCC 43541]